MSQVDPGLMPHTPKILLCSADLQGLSISALVALRAALHDDRLWADGVIGEVEPILQGALRAIDQDLLARTPRDGHELALMITVCNDAHMVWEDGLTALRRAAETFLKTNQPKLLRRASA